MQLCCTPSTILRMVPLPQEGGLNVTDQKRKFLILIRFFEGSSLRELSAKLTEGVQQGFNSRLTTKLNT